MCPPLLAQWNYVITDNNCSLISLLPFLTGEVTGDATQSLLINRTTRSNKYTVDDARLN
jgi:hypothetical protein